MYDLEKERPEFPNQVRNLWELIPGKEYYLVHRDIKTKIVFIGHYQLGKLDVFEKFRTCFWYKFVNLKFGDYVSYGFASDHGLEPYNDRCWNPVNHVENI